MNNLVLAVSMVTLTLCSAVHVAHAMEYEEQEAPCCPRDVTRLIEEKFIQLTPKWYSPPSIAKVTEAVNKNSRKVEENGISFEIDPHRGAIMGKFSLISFCVYKPINRISFSYFDSPDPSIGTPHYVVLSPIGEEYTIRNLRNFKATGYREKEQAAGNKPNTIKSLLFLTDEDRPAEDIRIFMAMTTKERKIYFQKFQLIKWIAEDSLK